MFSPKLIALVEALNIKVKFNESKRAEGSYCPHADTITISTVIARDYDQVLAHELIHATGHHERLNRGLISAWSKQYAINPLVAIPESERTKEIQFNEECIAEWGSALLLESLGLRVNLAEVKHYIHRHGSSNGLPSIDQSIAASRAANYLNELLQECAA